MSLRSILALIICSFFVFSTLNGMECPKQPRQSVKDWDTEVDLAVLKIGKKRGVDLRTRVSGTTRDLLVKLPNADRVYLEQMMYATYCSALRDDKSLTEAEKAERVRIYNVEVHRVFMNVQPSKPRQKTALSINYMRLFGAYQVPWLMNTIYQVKHGAYKGKPSMVPIEGNLSADEPLYRFWKSWQYSRSMPLKTSLWDDFSRDAPISLLCAACENKQMAMDYLTIADFWANNGPGSEPHELQEMVRKYIPAPAKRAGVTVLSDENVGKMYATVANVSHNVGFLFLIIENVSDGYVSDIKLNYKESVYNAVIKIERRDKMYGCQGFELDFGRLATPAMLSNELQNTRTENQKTFYGLKKGDSVLWLLAVYLKDDKGFPKRFLSHVIKPTRITYREPISQQLVSLRVRDPLGEKAATIAVPFGWHGQ